MDALELRRFTGYRFGYTGMVMNAEHGNELKCWKWRKKEREAWLEPPLI